MNFIINILKKAMIQIENNMMILNGINIGVSIFEFVGLKENKNYLETDLEKALLSHLMEFLLELGRGFSVVASHQRIKIGAEYYYVQIKMM